MAKKIVGIVLILAALGTVLLGMKAGGAAPENKKIIESAVVVADGKVQPENEGKVVMVTGTLEAPLPFVDEETGVAIDTIVAYRYVEKARVVLGDEDEEDTWTWDATSELGGNKKLVAPGVTIGEFAVSEELMYPVPNLKQRDDYSASDLEAGGWNEFRDKGLSYLYRMDYMPREGDEVHRDTFLKDYATSKQKNEGTLRVRYNVVEDGIDMDYTIIGLQTNGKLEKVPGMDLIPTVSGHLTKEAMLAYAESSSNTSVVTSAVIAAVFGIFGVLMLVKAFRSGNAADKTKKKA